MATNIKVPNSAWHTQEISVEGSLLNITFKYNTADAGWYISLSTINDNLILGDTKVMPNQSLTGRYKYLEGLPSGNLWCVRRKNDFSPISRDNLGIGKTYELWWLSAAEEEEVGVDGTIQL